VIFQCLDSGRCKNRFEFLSLSGSFVPMLLWVTDGRRDTQTHTHIYTEPVSASVCVCVIRHPVSHLFLSVSSPPRDAFFWNYAHEKLIEVG
jgi:hypothetical protein